MHPDSLLILFDWQRQALSLSLPLTSTELRGEMRAFLLHDTADMSTDGLQRQRGGEIEMLWHKGSEEKKEWRLSSLDFVLRPQEGGSVTGAKFGGVHLCRHLIARSHETCARVRPCIRNRRSPLPLTAKAQGSSSIPHPCHCHWIWECARYSNLASPLQIPKLGRQRPKCRRR